MPIQISNLFTTVGWFFFAITIAAAVIFLILYLLLRYLEYEPFKHYDFKQWFKYIGTTGVCTLILSITLWLFVFFN